MRRAYTSVALVMAVAVSVGVAFYLRGAEPAVGVVVKKHHEPFRIQTVITIVGKSVIQNPVPIPESWNLIVRTESGRRRTVSVSETEYVAVKVGDRWAGGERRTR